jgi:MFS family permease
LNLERKKVKITGMLTVARFNFAAMAAGISYFSYAFYEPVAALYLKESLGLSEVNIGIFFAIFPVFYTVGCLVCQFVPIQIAKRLVVMTCSLLFGIANFFTGPSKLLNLPADSLTMMIVGQAMLGVFGAMMVVPSLPEMIDSLKQKYPGLEKEASVKASGLYNSLLATGQVLGPIFATNSVELVGFRLSCDI